MKNNSKKILSAILALILVLSSIMTIITVSASAGEVSGAEIVSYARKYIGYPYSYGHQGPDSFDCSGFVNYVFKHFGITMPVSSSELWNNPTKYGTVIGYNTLENAKMGDVISWSGHVAIYTENGNCVEALNQSRGVTEDCPVSYHYSNGSYRVIHVYGVSGGTSSYTVSYNANGGSGAPSSQTKNSSSDIKLSSAKPTRSGYTFKEWNTKADGTGKAYAPGAAYKTNANLTLYAIWTPHTHSYSSKVTTAATCTKNGVKTFTCSCGKSYTESIPATGHSYKTTVIKPTCTEQGFTNHVCVNCGNSYKDSYVYAKGHSFGNWTILVQATKYSAGIKQRTCTECGQKQTQTIPKTTTSAEVKGDVNGDGIVNSTDALQVLQFSVGKSNLTGSKKTAADVDGNGTVNSSDALTMLCYSVGKTKSL